MKDVISLFLISVAVAAFCGCSVIEEQNPPEPTEEKATISVVPTGPISFSAKGGEQRIVITSNQESWEATSHTEGEPWCFLETDGSDLIIYAFENTSSDPKPTATVVITVGKEGNTASKSIIVNQGGSELSHKVSTIPPEGGTVDSQGLMMKILPQTFDTTVDVKVKTIAKTTTMGEYEASSYYEVVIPASFAQPIEVSLEANSSIDGEAFIFVSTEGCATSYEGVTKGRSLVPATLKDGRYVASIDPSTEKIPSEEKVTLQLGLVKDYTSGDTGTKTIVGEKKCLIITPKAYYTQNAELSEFAERAYKYLESLGYSFERRNSQIEIEFVSLNDDYYGYYTSSKLGINWSNITMNYKKLGNLNEVKRTIIHEMVHLVNAIYDPRFYFTKAVSQGKFLWMDEAMAVWSEEFVNEGASEVQQDNCTAPLSGFYPLTSTTTDQDHGYGMAALVKYLALKKGDKSIVKLAQQWHNGANSIYDCFDKAFPDLFSSLGDYYSFLCGYLEGEVYSVYKSGILFTYHQNSNNFKQTISDTTAFSIPLALAPYSVSIAKFQLDYSDIEDKQITITTSGDAASYSLYKYNSETQKVDFIDNIYDDSYNYTDLDNLKGNERLYVVAYNTGDTSKDVTVSAQLTNKGYVYCMISLWIDKLNRTQLPGDKEYTGSLSCSLNDFNPKPEGTYTKSGNNMVYKEIWNYGDEDSNVNGSMEITIDPSSKKIISGTIEQTTIWHWTTISGMNDSKEVVAITFKDISLEKDDDVVAMYYEDKKSAGSVSGHITNVSQTITTYSDEYADSYDVYSNPIAGTDWSIRVDLYKKAPF